MVFDGSENKKLNGVHIWDLKFSKDMLNVD